MRPLTPTESIFFWLVELSLLVGPTMDLKRIGNKSYNRNDNINNKIDIGNEVNIGDEMDDKIL